MTKSSSYALGTAILADKACACPSTACAGPLHFIGAHGTHDVDGALCCTGAGASTLLGTVASAGHGVRGVLGTIASSLLDTADMRHG